MDTEIRKGNMIPGSCEEFTRPEEIQALSKFLKQGRESLDNSITLNQDNLEVKGRKFIENPDRLPDSLEVLNPNSNQISSLVSSKEWLDSGKDLVLLRENKDQLVIKDDLSTLTFNREDLRVNGNNISSLPKTSKHLDGTVPENVLQNLIEKITNGNVIDSLDTSRLDLQEIPEDFKKLETERESLTRTENQIEKLGTDRLELNDRRKNILSDSIEHLSMDDSLDSLGKYKSEISVKDKIIDLEDKKENITVEQINALPSTKEQISGRIINNGSGLSDYKETIKNNKEENIKLDNTLSKIEDISLTPELSRDRVLIKSNNDSYLSNNIEQLKKVEKEESLEDTLIEVEGISEVKKLNNYSEFLKTDNTLDELKEKKEKINLPERKTKLSDVKTDLKNTNIDIEYLPRENEKLKENSDKNIKLEEGRLPLNSKSNIEELDTDQEKLEVVNKQINLSEKKEEIGGTQEELNSLKNHKEELVDAEKTIELSSDLEKLDDSNFEEISLETDLDLLNNINNSIELEDTIIKLGKDIDSELSKYSEKLSPVEKEIAELEDQLENLSIESGEIDLGATNVKISDVGKEITETVTLDNKLIHADEEFNNEVEKLIDSSVKIINSDTTTIDELINENSRVNLKEIISPNTLSDYIESISDNRENESLEDYKEEISDSRENSLSDYKENISDDRENELEDYKNSISDLRENELEDYKESISDNRENSLLGEDTLVFENNKNSNTWGESLENYVESISDNRENELEDYKENISDLRENELEDYIESISDDRDNNLLDENTLVSEKNKNLNTWEESLEDYKEEISDSRENSLSDYKENISDDRENELEDYKENINPTNVDDLDNETIELISDDTTKNDHKQFNPDEDGLYDSVIVNPNDSESENHKQFNPDTDTLNDKTDTLNLDNHLEISSLNTSTVQVGEDSNDKLNTNGTQHKQFNPDEDNLKKTISDILSTRDDLSLYYTNILKFAQSKNFGNSGWTAKVSSLISAYLSSDKISQEKAEEFEQALYKTIMFEEPVITKPITKPEYVSELGGKKELLSLSSEVVGLSSESEDMISYELPGFNLMGGGLNPSSYLRWVAENTVGKLAKGKLRAVLLDEALGLLIYGRDQLEKLTKSNRDRLPGDDGGALGSLVSGGLGNAIKGAISGVTGALLGGSSLDMSIPHNRPKSESDGNNIMPRNEGLTTFEGLNDKGAGGKEEDVALGKSLLKAAVGGIFGGSDVGSYKFKNKYLEGKGIETTLNELCVDTRASEVKSVEQLYQAIRQSPYIGNSGKVTSYDYDTTKVRTLDSNCYWEIIFTPYAGEENGNVSYLPPINEINVWNNHFHGVNTGITTYIPVNSFELGKTKLTTKTLGLFDGEISYPVSMEFTNEFRLTFVDDQYKSWRTYFERCMDASIYNSTRHEKKDYEGTNWKKITAIDKRYNLGAPYKNVTFRCIIYSLTPQMSTISKYDLLLVMKDFVEERTGEIDGGANDLTVSFSIVGENPKEEIPKAAKLNVPSEKENKNTSRTGMKSIISKGVSSVIGAFS